jgi:DNA-binding NarL/FixJ family response regulator
MTAPALHPESGVAILDPDPVSLDLALTILATSGIKPVCLQDPRDALKLARDGNLSLLITELRLPFMDGLICLDLLQNRAPNVQVIFVAAQATRADVHQALRRRRAFDFFFKPLAQPQDFLLSVHLALDQANTARHPVGPFDGNEAAHPTVKLSKRELAVAKRLVAGFSAQEIAREFNVKEKSVRNTLSGLYRQLGVTGRTEAVLRCLELGIARKQEVSLPLQ